MLALFYLVFPIRKIGEKIELIIFDLNAEKNGERNVENRFPLYFRLKILLSALNFCPFVRAERKLFQLLMSIL